MMRKTTLQSLLEQAWRSTVALARAMFRQCPWALVVHPIIHVRMYIQMYIYIHTHTHI